MILLWLSCGKQSRRRVGSLTQVASSQTKGTGEPSSGLPYRSSMPGPGSRRWRSPGPSRAWRRLSSRLPSAPCGCSCRWRTSRRRRQRGRGPRAGGARSRRPGRSCRSGASGCAASACRRRCERPLAVAVSAVRPATAQLVGLGVHRGVHDLFGESGEQLPHVDGAVAETGHGEYVRRRV